ncbi:class I SAM-dependent methyltransferase [Halalkalicoccus paucihalophilus]|uniref:class I SAM-dependent methyltransferase n=1 Tax=Halalkalicoccus paucihalophilus TaxID=1008153 RepID=UPI00082A84F7|nr:class I SAM-dependent methyltransferase [Halalkalicoccus paucihalophilus]
MADAFGRMVEDFHHGRLVERPVYRRDDGHVSEAHLAGYFADYNDWSDLEKRMAERVSGSVLDVGCGVGRTTLWARREGHAVCGVDRSPGAIRVARERGIERAAVGDMTALGIDTGFDTVLVVGKQLGLGRSRAALRGTLAELARVTEPGGRLVADLNDPTHPDARAEPEYLNERTVEEGLTYRRFRVEYDGLVGPWIDLLMTSPATLRGVAEETGWTVEAVVESETSAYAVVLGR